MTRPSLPRRLRLPALTLLAALVVAGCGGSPAPELTPEPSAGGRAPTAAASRTPSPTPSPQETVPTVTPTPDPLSRTAADGTKYAACADGDCEVSVAKPVKFEFDEFTLSITDVTDKGIDFKITSPNGGTSTGSIGGGYCLAFLTANSMSSSCYAGTGATPPRPDPDKGELALELLELTGGTAIIRLTSG